jgi:MtN3 and saliva related transmembrane protein
MIEAIGFVAGTLTTLAFVPQVVTTWKSRSGGGMSTATLLAFTTGVGLWVVYGVLQHATSVVVFNTVTFALGLSLIAMKRRFSGRTSSGTRP